MPVCETPHICKAGNRAPSCLDTEGPLEGAADVQGGQEGQAGLRCHSVGPSRQVLLRSWNAVLQGSVLMVKKQVKV